MIEPENSSSRPVDAFNPSEAERRLHLSPNQRAWRRFRSNRAAWFSAWFFLGLVLVILIWPAVGSKSATKTTAQQFIEPTSAHWFGTDVHGRDLLSRILHGSRISLLVGAVGATVSLVIGVLWGAIAGYLGGRWDNFMMRVVDILYSLPSIIFVIVMITTLEGLFRNWVDKFLPESLAAKSRLLLLFFGLGAVSWLTMSRIVRGQVLTLRNRQFVDASRALGASHRRILTSHILPNVYGVVIVYLTLTIPSIILYESFLSFLGLGIQPPEASLGTLISEGASLINPIRIYWWLVLFPAATLAILLLALNFVGDGLRDAFDPRGEK